MTSRYLTKYAINEKVTKITNDATKIWPALNGVINVYKPVGISSNQVRRTIISNICRDLNQMKVRPSTKYVSIDKTCAGALTVNVRPSLADDPLVVGARYQNKDIRTAPAAPLGRNTSGVLRINDGTRISTALHNARPTRAYHLIGRLGEATDTHYADGKVVEKATFRNIKRGNIDALLASMQASHQKKMFELCGVDLQSQAAYELALKGPLRPDSRKIPVLYGIKCLEFNAPDFTIEIQCLNEYEQYLATLIHEIGIQLHSVAHCKQIRCIRHSHFDLQGSLLRKHWTLQSVVDSMKHCQKIIDEHPNMIKQTDIQLTN